MERRMNFSMPGMVYWFPSAVDLGVVGSVEGTAR
jgi:hypothetical protein